MEYREKIKKFLDLDRIAVTGVSTEKPDAANIIFKKLKNSDYEVFPVNPKSRLVDGFTCYPNVSEIPGKVKGVVIASPPGSARKIIDDCLRQEIKYVWFHSSINNGSYEAKTVEYAEKQGMVVIPTGCPMMYLQPVDFGHKCIRWVLGLTGKIPKR